MGGLTRKRQQLESTVKAFAVKNPKPLLAKAKGFRRQQQRAIGLRKEGYCRQKQRAFSAESADSAKSVAVQIVDARPAVSRRKLHGTPPKKRTTATAATS